MSSNRTNRFTRKFDALIDSGLALFYPQGCALCGASVERRADAPACAACWSKTRVFKHDDAICWKCGEPALAAVPEDAREGVRCRRCDEEAWTAARAVGSYDGALQAAVLALKREPFVGARLAAFLNERRQTKPLNTATRIVPVPLHARRERERGFNQAAVLGHALAQASGLPLDEASLVRTIHTEMHRANMDAIARRASVEAAFVVRRPRLIKDERILLVDDVFTTGATTSACALALKAAGAREVFVLTIARAGAAKTVTGNE